MNKILNKQQLSEKVYRIKVEAPYIAEAREAGQFIIFQLDSDFGERIPLTITDANKEEGTIDLIFQIAGKTTEQLSNLNKGDTIANLLGPLGQPTHIEKRENHIVCVGGGVGAAPLFPIVQALKEIGNRVHVILGARNSSMIILEEEMRQVADKVTVITDDGSTGRKGLVTEPLKEACEENPKPSEIFAIGPAIMMKFCAETTRPYSIPTVVSLNTIMVDGTGMCGGCRVTVNNETKFVCVDGPEFDGHLVDFNNMMQRLSSFKEKELEDHECYLEEMVREASERAK